MLFSSCVLNEATRFNSYVCFLYCMSWGNKYLKKPYLHR